MMRKMLLGFRKEALVEFICQRHWCIKKVALEKDLLFMDWDLQAIAAQKEMDAACADIDAAKTIEEKLAGYRRFDRASKAHRRADRTYKRLEKVRNSK